jgi:hypothetical protein
MTRGQAEKFLVDVQTLLPGLLNAFEIEDQAGGGIPPI